MASLQYQGPPRDIAPERLFVNSSGTGLTRHGTCVNHACPPSMPSELHSFGPRLTRHGTCVNHACPSSLPFTLDVELGRETIFHGDLIILVLHAFVETSLVARIFIVHQSPKSKAT